MKSIRLIFQTVLFMLLAIHSTAQEKQKEFLFQNPDLSFEKRVDDLVSRLTLEEKVSQMLNSSPAIPRLDIPAYDW